MVEDEQLTGSQGRAVSADGSRWTARCAKTPVDSVFSVQDAPFPIQ